jgi:acyl carrier protein
MNQQTAISKVRACLVSVKPGVDLDHVSDDTPLLEARVINSFDVLELILHLERASGRKISRRQLVPGSFRDMATIARVFFDGVPAA